MAPDEVTKKKKKSVKFADVETEAPKKQAAPKSKNKKKVEISEDAGPSEKQGGRKRRHKNKKTQAE